MLTSRIAKPRILVFEDNYLMADAICNLVRDCGCDVAGAVGDVGRGVQFLHRGMIDGAVIDISLHGRLCFAICEELRRRHVPFFFLTGHAAQARVPPQFRDTTVLTKPLDVGQFKSALSAIRSGLPRDLQAHRHWGNALLDRLDPATLLALQPGLEPVALHQGQKLETAGQPVSHVFFVTHGLASLVAGRRPARRIESTLVGAEGATGVTALLDARRTSLLDAIVQLPGAAWRIAAADLSAMVRSQPALRECLSAYVHGLLADMLETTVATGHANIEQRLARWLLMASERCATPRLSVTHEQLSRALAVRRSGITVALHMLESRRLVRSRRRLIEIVDRAGLVRETDGLHEGDATPREPEDHDDRTAG